MKPSVLSAYGSVPLFIALSAPPATAQCVTELLSPLHPVADGFGTDVALARDVLVVGAAADGPGRVYVYERSATGWVLDATLTASDGVRDDRFGSAVAFDGETIVVGAASRDTGGVSDSGAAYVFERIGSAWVETHILEPPTPAEDDRFGEEAAVDGDALFVSSSHGVDGELSGTVHAFDREGGSWQLAQELTSSNPGPYHFFGRALDIDGDRAIVGSSGEDSFSGAAYAFARAASGWIETERFVGSPVTSFMGRDVAIAGNEAMSASRVIGAFLFSEIDSRWSLAELLYVSGGFDAELDFTANADFDGSAWAFAARSDVNRTAVTIHTRQSGDWEILLIEIIPDHQPGSGRSIAVGPQTAAFGLRETSTGTRTVRVYTWPRSSTVSCFCLDPVCGTVNAWAGCRNSATHGAKLSVCGRGSVAADDLVLTMTGLPPRESALIYAGRGEQSVPFGDGLQCIAEIGGRFAVQSSGPTGMITQTALVAYSQANFSDPIAAGDTVRFQGWYRDPSGPCGTLFNTSSVVEVEFVP